MKDALDTGMVLVLLSTLMFLGSSRIVSCIRILAVQGMILGLLPLMVRGGGGLHAALLALGTVAVKGIVLPRLLLRARRQADVPREVDPFVGFGASLFVGVLLLVISFWLGARLPLPSTPPSTLIVPVAFFILFAGLFVIVSRRKALTQVLGYLMMENGIYTFGVAFVRNQPLLIEMGILLDVFVAVFVMGIAIFHISREFDHIDIDRLSTLTDVPRQEGNGA